MSEHVLEDLIEVKSFAQQVHRCPRTIKRWMDETDGLPYVQLGARRLIHLPTARQWIMSKMCRSNPTRHKKVTRPPRRKRKAERARHAEIEATQ